MSRRNRFFSPLVLIPVLALSASFAGAQEEGGECASDSDCPADGICQKAQWVNGCDAVAGSPVDPEGTGAASGVGSEDSGEDQGDRAVEGDGAECDNTVHEAEFGTCYIPPPQCDSDDDCDEYLSCVQENTGACWEASDGTSGCSEEDPDAPSYCQVSHSSECESDSDCEREFECVEAPVACLTIAIACPTDDPDCDVGTSTCEGEGTKECQPKEIKCEADNECPSDWSCMGTTSWECSGSGGTAVEPSDGSGGVSTPDGTNGSEGDSGSGGEVDSSAPMPPEEGTDVDEVDEAVDEDLPDEEGGDGARKDAPQEEICVERATVGSCYPDAWGGANTALGGEFASDEGSSDSSKTVAPRGPGDPGSPDADGNSTDDDSEEGAGTDADDSGAGCSVAAGPSAPASSAWFLSLLLLVPGLRRRVRSASHKS